MILKATLPTRLLRTYHTLCIGQAYSSTTNHAGYYRVIILSAVPPLALVAADGSELQGKNLAYMHSLMGKVRCSFAVVVRQGFAVVASMAVVVAGAGEEHVVEADKIAVVGANFGGSVPEMVLRRIDCGSLAVVDTIEEVRSAVGFGCNMLRLDLP